MLYASVLTCPVFGGTLASYDFDAIKDRPGVHSAVEIPDGIAVVADSFWRAKTALEAMPIEWDFGANANVSSTDLRARQREALTAEAALAHQQGDVERAMAEATTRIEAVYELPYLSHSTMEPMNCTAQVQADRVDVWVGTQNPEGSLAVAAEVTGVDPANVHVHNCFLGGGFGRRSRQDDVRQSVIIAKALAGRPVKMIWTREEDTQHGFYRPMATIQFAAGLGPDGMPVAWQNRSVCDFDLRDRAARRDRGRHRPDLGRGAARAALRDPAPADRPRDAQHPRAGGLLALGRQLAERVRAGVVHRRGRPRGRQGPVRAAARAAERPGRLAEGPGHDRGEIGLGLAMPRGQGRGMAIHESFGTIVGEVAEVSVSQDGSLKVDRVVCAVDSGHVVNPTTVEMQMESGIVYGLTAALYGEITIREGRVEQANFDTYEMLRLAEMPVVETYLALSGGDKWGGIGEPGVPPIAPAVCNAIFAATGKRIRSLPLKHHDLSWA